MLADRGVSNGVETRRVKLAGGQPAKILEVETQADPWHAVRQAMPSMICPQTTAKVVGGHGTSIDCGLGLVLTS